MNSTESPLRLSRMALVTATILTGLSAGFFFTYEVSVTLGLAEVSDTTYVETFQAINATIRNAPFGIVFFGPLPAIALAAAVNWKNAPSLARLLLATAFPLYLVGFLITFAGNVPLNNELGALTNVTPETAAVARAAFESEWNQLNLLRSVAVAAGFATLAGASVVIAAKEQQTSLDDPALKTRQTVGL